MHDARGKGFILRIKQMMITLKTWLTHYKALVFNWPSYVHTSNFPWPELAKEE